jgi:hypothetical protein
VAHKYEGRASYLQRRHLATRRGEQLVDDSEQPVRQNTRHLVRTYTSSRAESRAVRYAVTLRQNAQVWTRPNISMCVFFVMYLAADGHMSGHNM